MGNYRETKQTGRGYASSDPLDPAALRRDNRQQLLADVLRNAAGVPENLLTMGTGLVDMAGTGLGTLAGMAKQKLSGEDIDWDAAAETAQGGNFTFAPRSTGAKETQRGIGIVGEKVEGAINDLPRTMTAGGMRLTGDYNTQRGQEALAEIPTLSELSNEFLGPGATALGYAALNIADPEMIGPATAKAAALRAGSRIARSATPGAPEVRRAGSPYKGGRESGAYSLADLADTEGNFEFTSPSLAAFDRLKPQERGRVSGEQLRKALMREGAKKEELSWMGLDDVLNSKDLIEVADVRQLAETNQPRFEARTARAGAASYSDEDIYEQARQRAWEDDDLEYPINITRDGETIETVTDRDEARQRIRELKEELRDSEREYYLENISEHLGAEELAAMSDEQKRIWADNQAYESVANANFDTERDFDSEPTNLDDITERWEEEIRRRPEDYGLTSGGDAPAYGEHTVGRRGRNREQNYSVNTVRLTGEGRYFRGTHREPPDFLEPYMQQLNRTDDAASGQLSLLDDTDVPKSKAFQIEALRRNKMNENPDRDLLRQNSDESHYPDYGENQMLFTRETDRAAPSWGSTQRGIGPVAEVQNQNGSPISNGPQPGMPMRLIEEAQSDWLQKGRKTGWADEKGIEKARRDEKVALAKHEEKFKQNLAQANEDLQRPEIAQIIHDINNLPSDQLYARGIDAGYAQQLQERLATLYTTLEDANQPITEKLRAYGKVFDTLYYMSRGPAESIAWNARKATQEGDARVPKLTEKLTPSSPMRETPQYTKLAVIDALRRAVKEGQQYLAWTPGDVHTKRWGTDTFQYGIRPDNPRQVRWTSEPEVSKEHGDQTGLQRLQAKADETLQDGYSNNAIDLDSPDIEQELYNIVDGYLDYGSDTYPQPEVFRVKRAAMLREMLEKLSKEVAESGQGKASHYSPRAVGYENAYGPIDQMVIDVLRGAGSKAEIKDIPISEVASAAVSAAPLRGIEIDPELARAVKRGLPLPY